MVDFHKLDSSTYNKQVEKLRAKYDNFTRKVKTQFIRDVMIDCGITSATLRNKLKGRSPFTALELREVTQIIGKY